MIKRANLVLTATSILMLSVVSGCASVRQLVHGHVCPPDSHCSTDVGQTPPYVPESIVVDETPMQTCQEWPSGELEQINSLVEADNAIQEQLTKLDENAELHRTATDKHKSDIATVSAAVEAFHKELEQNRSEVERLKSTIHEQRAENERILASLEHQLVDVLTAYESE